MGALCRYVDTVKGLPELAQNCLNYGIRLFIDAYHSFKVVPLDLHDFGEAKKIMKNVYEKRLNELIGVAVSTNSLGLGAFNPQEYKKRTILDFCKQRLND